MKIITIDILVSYVIDKHYLNGSKIHEIGLKIVNDILKINDIRTVFI